MYKVFYKFCVYVERLFYIPTSVHTDKDFKMRDNFFYQQQTRPLTHREENRMCLLRLKAATIVGLDKE